MFKKFNLFFYALAVLVLAQSCKPKGCMDPKALNFDPEVQVYDASCEYPEMETELIMDFRMVADGDEVWIDDEFEDGNGHIVAITKLQFYLSDMYLENGSQRTLLSNIGFIDMDTALAENPDAPKWFNTFEAEVDPGTYTGIAFDIGVKPDLNRIDPTTYDTDQPLSITPNMYWGWQSMYIFVKIEGIFDRDKDGTTETPFFFHTGLDELFIDLPAFQHSFEIVEDQKKRLKFHIDAKKLFTTLNLDEYYQSHTVIEDPVNGSLKADTASQMFTQSFEEVFSIAP